MIRIGIVGESRGNGHPYSWSAILNGYKKGEMEYCEYQAIPRYLEKEDWDRDHIKNARAHMIWTPFLERSRKIADTCTGLQVVEDLQELVNGSDAIIIARDDYVENRSLISLMRPRGKAILFDKQIAGNTRDTRSIVKECDTLGCPIQTGSPFAKLMGKWIYREITDDTVEIRAKSPKSWFNYGIHLVDPVVTALEGLGGYGYTIGDKKIDQKCVTLSLHFNKKGGHSVKAILTVDEDYKGGFLFELVNGAGEAVSRCEIDSPFRFFKDYLLDFARLAEMTKNDSSSSWSTKEAGGQLESHIRVQEILDTIDLSSLSE